MFILLLGDVVSYMWYQLCHLRPLLLYVFSFWMICPLISRMLNSSTIIVYLSIYPFIFIHFSSVQLLSHVQLFVIPWTTAHQAFLSPAPGVHPRPCPLSRWYHPTFSSLAVPFSSCPQSFPESGPFQISQLFASGGQILEFQLQHESFQWTPRTDFVQDGLVGSPCSPRDSQASSPKQQFKSINSSALSSLSSPILTSIHDYRKNHSLD